MKKLDLKATCKVQENIKRLAQLFPHTITESSDTQGRVQRRIDFDALRKELTGALIEGPQERYHLNWPGKGQALLKSNEPVDAALRPYRAESCNFDATQNVFIEGDNLKVLKLLKNSYWGKIKMIYIDPPYNTGKDFIYRDKFAQKNSDYFVDSAQTNSHGEKLVANLDSGGRFHSNWCSMMYSRLKVARPLLREDGAIFISCDESEHPRLRMMMDEIFGEKNFIADLVWASGRKNNARYISVSHEYIVCYVKNEAHMSEHNTIWRQKKQGLDEIYAHHKKLTKKYASDYDSITEGMKAWYKALPPAHPAKAHSVYCYADARGLYVPENISRPGGGGPMYKVLHPKTKKPVKLPSRGWVLGEKKMQQMIKEDRIHFSATEATVPGTKSYLKDKPHQVPYSVFHQSSAMALRRLRSLMGSDVFDFPKDENVIKNLVEIITNSNCGGGTPQPCEDIILDFFAGSGTTAHAVMQLNAEDGGRRKFIMVQLPEECNKGKEDKRGPASNNELKLADDGDAVSEASGTHTRVTYNTIADIGRERIRRVGKKIQTESGKPVDMGFRSFKLDSSNIVDVSLPAHEVQQSGLKLMGESIKPDRSAEDLLFQVLLQQGLPLHTRIYTKTILGHKVFCVLARGGQVEAGRIKGRPFGKGRQDNLVQGSGLSNDFAEVTAGAQIDLMACFDEASITKPLVLKLVDYKPSRIIFSEKGFKDDSAMVNTEKIFQQLSPSTRTMCL